MIRNLKALGLVIMAVLAVSAVGASGASAASFHSEASNTQITGVQSTTHKLTMDPASLTCKVATFAGAQSAATVSSWTLTPTYSECTFATIFGNIAVTINFNGCDYQLAASGHTEIKCPEGKSIVMSGPGCTTTIPAQTIGTAASFISTGSGTNRDIDVTYAASGIKYSYSGFTCGSGTGTANGTYTGTSTMRAVGTVGIWQTP